MTSRSSLRAAFGLCAIAICFASPARADFHFTSFDGPGLNGGGTTVNGINNNGSVVGFSSDNAANPALFTNFVRDAAGNFTTLNIGGSPLANANGINDANQVVGTFNNNAFFLSNNNNTLTVLPQVNPGNTTMEVAFGINNGGSIVGQYADSTTNTMPGFVYSGGKFTVLNPVANATVTNAQGINDNGLVLGFYSLDGVHQHGFTFDTQAMKYTLLADPNVNNLVLTQFLGLNDMGQSVGYYQTTDGSQHGFLYDLVKNTYTFLDDPNAAKTGTSITQITGINNQGEIAGFYVDAATGLQRGFTASAVPEPSSLSLAAIGLGLVFGIARRRRMLSKA